MPVADVHAAEAGGGGHVTAHGPGLVGGRVGKRAEFKVVTKDAGPGGLSLAISGPSRAEVSCRDNADGSSTVQYLPLAAGSYTIAVKFRNRHVRGSPFAAQIVDGFGRRAEVAVSHGSVWPLKMAEISDQGLVATVRDPSNSWSPCSLERRPSGRLGAWLCPQLPGHHWVSVTRGGRHIPNSPFRIDVSQLDVAHAGRLRLDGAGLRAATAGLEAHFVVDAAAAGYGPLAVAVEGPARAEMRCVDLGGGRCLVSWTAGCSGLHTLSVRYGSTHAPGSPFTVNAAPAMELSASTTEAQQQHQQQQQQEDEQQFKEKQKEKKKTKRGALATGAGLASGAAGRENRFAVTADAPGALAVSVEGPSKARLRLSGLDDSNACGVEWTAPLAGEYCLAVTFDGRHVDGSPFRVALADDDDDDDGGVGVDNDSAAAEATARVHGDRLDGAAVGEWATFVVDPAPAGAAIAVSVSGPDKVPLRCRRLQEGRYEFRFLPPLPGDYRLLVACRLSTSAWRVVGSPLVARVAARRSARQFSS